MQIQPAGKVKKGVCNAKMFIRYMLDIIDRANENDASAMRST